MPTIPFVPIWLSRVVLLLAGMATILSLTGCVMALAAVPMAYAVATTQAKSTVKVTFAPSEVEDSAALAAITNLAIWPQVGWQASLLGGQQSTHVNSAMLAEQLAKSGKLGIVTPLTVAKVFEKSPLAVTLENMTADEACEVFRRVADETGADGVFLNTDGNNIKTKTQFLPIARNKLTRTTTLLIYSRAKDAVVWQQDVGVEVTMTAKTKSDAEVQADVAPQVVDRVLQVIGKLAAPQSPSEVASQSKSPAE